MEKYYYELKATPNLYYELFLDLVSSITQEAIEEDNETIIIRSESELDLIKEGIEAFTKELSIAFETEINCIVTLEKKENKDWVNEYQKSVQPIEIGNFFIAPSWYDLSKVKDKNIVIIDPTLSFGSGHHETTSNCVKAIDSYVQKNMSVCDVGCGSGILAIVAAQKGALVDICDTDEVAVEDAKKNFMMNHLSPNHSWTGSIGNSPKSYDVIVANIVADVLTFISKDLIGATKVGGILILSGIMEQYCQKVLQKYENKCELLEEISQNEWKTYIFKKIKD